MGEILEDSSKIYKLFLYNLSFSCLTSCHCLFIVHEASSPVVQQITPEVSSATTIHPAVLNDQNSGGTNIELVQHGNAADSSTNLNGKKIIITKVC